MDDPGGHLAALRGCAPLVHCITNLVAMDLTANALLAVGASPAMVYAEAEAEAFAGLASALLVNIGTPYPAWGRAMETCAARAGREGRPWVLDPVAAGATPFRSALAERLVGAGPTLVRGNASEVLALAGAAGAAPKGVDSAHTPEQALGAARELARALGGVVAVTGPVDHVTDGERLLRVGNGVPLMARVTAFGCAASAVCGAFLTVVDDRLLAAAQGLAVFGLAGELAAERSAGPGELRWRLLDALYGLDANAVRAGVRVS